MLLKRWDTVLTTEESNALLQDLALWHAGQLSPAAGREDIIAGVASNDFSLLCHTDLDYSRHEILDALHLRQILAFYQKREDLDLGIDKEQVALVKFWESEQLCCETNDIFRKHGRGHFQFAPRVDAAIFAAQRKISRVLGDCPNLGELKVRFGPGATTQVKKRDASPRFKLGQVFTCSEDLLGMLPDVLWELLPWVLHACEGKWEPISDDESAATVSVEVVPAKLSFVPKNAKTYRSICVEPALNSMFQLGVGAVIAERLSAVGVDIRDQTKNQRLAMEGSFTGALATLDLSSASDTISREIVSHLLPLDWFMLLDHLRSGHVEYKGVVHALEKFSSMGNGFTFPLETLIFWALASACVDAVDPGTPVSVYGDDIIVSSKAFPFTCEVLHACGFVPNIQKSFSSGPFRESCGKDYLSGIDIRPCYIKGPLSGDSVFTLHNYYVRSGQPDAANLVLTWIPEAVRLWGPDGYGDGHLLGDHTLKPHKRNLGWSGFTFETYTWKSRKSYRPSPGDALLPAYSIYESPLQPGLPDCVETPAWYQNKRYWWGQDLGFRNVSWRRVTAMRCYDSRPSSFTFDRKRNRLGVTLPGREGFKVISIYTLK